MSLNKFTSISEKKQWMKINCAELDATTANITNLQADTIIAQGIEDYKYLYSGSGSDVSQNTLSFISEFTVVEGGAELPYLRFYGTFPQSIQAGTTNISEVFPLGVSIRQDRNFTGYCYIFSTVNGKQYPLNVVVGTNDVTVSATITVASQDLGALGKFDIIVPLDV